MHPLRSDPVGPIRLADALGVASLALGTPMVTVPRRLLRAIGIRPDAKPVAVTVAVGTREFVAAGTILAMRHRRVGAWSRAYGDLIDLGLLATAFRNRRVNGPRVAGAAATVGSILGLDFLTAVRLSRAEGAHIEAGSSSQGTGALHDTAGGAARVRTAVTIRRPTEYVRDAFRTFGWSAFDPAAVEAAGKVRFTTAPGTRGTEVHIDHDPRVAGGALGATAMKLIGQSHAQKINDELRRFKAVLETGVEPRSEKTPQGNSAFGQVFQRPGQAVASGA